MPTLSESRSNPSPAFDFVPIGVLHERRYTVAAGSASIVTTTLTYPLDTIKSRLQVRKFAPPRVVTCAQAIYAEEGIGAFFRGLAVPLLSITAIRTLSFSIYTNTKISVANAGFFASERLPDKAVLGGIGGFTSGLLISILACPLELIKVNSQLEKAIADRRGVPYVPSTTLQTARSMWRTGHLRGLYYGYPMHTLRDTTGTALYFCLYDVSRAAMEQRYPNELPFGAPKTAAPFLCGATSGVLSWAAIAPIDLVKTRVQRDALSGIQPRDSALAIFRDRLAGGVGKLYRGLGVSVIRAAVSHGITWALIENIVGSIDREYNARGGAG